MKLNLNYKQLSNYRDSDGYINFDEVINKSLIGDDIPEREVRGNINREKDWIDITDGRILVKENAEEQQYSHFAELLSCELAKQVGLVTAEYDIAKYKGKVGVVTKDFLSNGGEILTINDMIGSGKENSDYPDATDICYVFDKLEEKFRLSGMKNIDIYNSLLQLRKQLLFHLQILETDGHTENISYIFGKNGNGDIVCNISPMYDTELCLMLGIDKDSMQKIANDPLKLSQIANLQDPRIILMPIENDSLEDNAETPLNMYELLKQQINYNYEDNYETDSERIWKETLDYLVEDENAYKFMEYSIEIMDIEKAIKCVEEKIKTKLPEDVKNMAIKSFNERKDAIKYELGLDIDIRGVDIDIEI